VDKQYGALSPSSPSREKGANPIASWKTFSASDTLRYPFLAIPLRETTLSFQHAFLVEPLLQRSSVSSDKDFLACSRRKASQLRGKDRNLTVAMLAAGLGQDDYLRVCSTQAPTGADDEPKIKCRR